jgi:replicative DNA helicase
MTIPELKRRIRKLKAEHMAEIVFIDYLSLLEGDDASLSRNERTIKIIAELKALAAETDMPIIALLQISRNPNQTISSDKVLEHCDLMVHIQQSGSDEWKLRMSNCLTITK